MATDGTVAWMDAASGAPAYSAQNLRQLDSALLMPGPASEPFSGRSGRRVNGSGLAVTVTSTGNGSVAVSPGAGVIYDSSKAGEGAWRFAIGTAKTGIALAARPGSGTSRIDLVVARLYDTGVGVGAAKEVKIEVVTGAANASPSAPALPVLSVELARLTVSSTSGAAISKTDSTTVAVAAGGIPPLATTAEMDALKTAGIAYRGLVVDNAQTAALHRYNGTSWVQQADRQTYSSITAPTVASASAPSATDVIIRKLQYHEETLSGGMIVKPFTQPFPNGILHVSVMTIAGTAVAPVVDAGTISKTSVRLIWPSAGSALVKFSLEAVGW